MAIKSLYLSNNGLYLINEERIYFANENKSYPLGEISLDRWMDIFNENTQFSIKHNLVEIKDLASFHRKVTYKLMEYLDFDLKSRLMLEYEFKFGKVLLTEDVLLIEGWFSNAWNWTKDKVVKAGGWVWDKMKQFGQFAVKTGHDFMACVTHGQCSPLFEDFRTMLFSPIGIAIETFLTVTGIGAIGPIIAWGIMLLWDSYLLMSGGQTFSWLNLIFDIVGLVAGGFAKVARSAFKAAGLLEKSVGKGLSEVIADGMKSPQTAGILQKIMKLIKGGLSKIEGVTSQAGKFLSEKLGMKWVGKVMGSISGQIDKILNSIGITGTAAKAGVKAGLIAQGVTAGAGLFGGGQSRLLKSMQAAGPAEYIDGVDF
jgi:hypothetical protein